MYGVLLRKTKGKTYEEIYGKEVASKLREERSKFFKGHKYRVGKKHTEATKKKQSISKIGEKNPNWNGGWAWKGDKVGYDSIHVYIRRRKPKPTCCESCGKKTKQLDLSFKHGGKNYKTTKYTRNIEDYQWFCRRCHYVYDGAWKINKKGSQ